MEMEANDSIELKKTKLRETKKVKITDKINYLWQSKSVFFGGIIVAIVIVCAIFAPFISTHDPFEMNMSNGLLKPGENGHILGTDQYGRDLFTRLIYGARVSLKVGVFAVLISMSIGVTLGLIAGYYGGIIDSIIMRIVDIFLSFPVILLAIALVASLGPGIGSVILALGLVYWTNYARVVRANVLAIKEEEYIQAAKTIGSSDFRIIFFNILPNSWAPIIVIATLGLGVAIVSEATLSFLGLGIQPPEASWGWTLAFGMKYIRESFYLSLYPGIAIMITVLGFNLLGDGIRDLTDTKLKRR